MNTNVKEHNYPTEFVITFVNGKTFGIIIALRSSIEVKTE